LGRFFLHFIAAFTLSAFSLAVCPHNEEFPVLGTARTLDLCRDGVQQEGWKNYRRVEDAGIVRCAQE